jgi:peroxiredoxin
MTADTPEPAPTPEAPTPRKPRKIFLLIGVLLAIALGIGLFTNLGTSDTTSGRPHDGGPVPTFSGANLNGSGTVRVSANGGGNGEPTVMLFFGNWCSLCHTELPPLAAEVRQQERSGGALSKIHVIGVDSEDTVDNAKSFIHSSGVSFPVAYDQDLGITSGLFYFEGDPHAVFVNGNGTISKIVFGALSAATFTADERALIPSGT